mgnify:CR=1 FL=1
MYSIVATQPGDISVLQKKEFDEISEILPNQVLIKNYSIGVNFIDIYFIHPNNILLLSSELLNSDLLKLSFFFAIDKK